MPDIDIDFCMNRRGEVIDYVTASTGATRSRRSSRSTPWPRRRPSRTVGRALDMPYGDVDRIAKMIPTTIGITLEQALEESPDLRKAYEAIRRFAN